MRPLPPRFPLFFAITALGISSVVTQITLARELLNVFEGTELVVGFFLFAWLLLTGSGALLGRFWRGGGLVLLFSLPAIAFLPFVQIVSLRLLRLAAAAPGAVGDARHLFAWLPLILLPYTFTSGYLLTVASTQLGSDDTGSGAGRVYVIDSIGDIAGGVLFSFVLVFLTDTFGALAFAAMLNVAAAVLLCRTLAVSRAVPAVIVAGAVALLATLPYADRFSLAWLYPSQTIEQVKETRFGRIVVTRYHDQRNVFENGVALGASGISADAEELVHFALSQLHHRPLRVLLVSGGLNGSIEQILAHDIERLDYVELDPEVAGIGRSLRNITDPRVHTVAIDGRRFIDRTTEAAYDAVILDLPAPSSLQVNRFYTVEFFRNARRALRHDGILAVALQGYGDYIGEHLGGLYRCVMHTGRSVFGEARLLPGNRGIALFSSRPLNIDIASALERKGIVTQYTNRHYLRGVLTADRLEQIDESLAGEAKLNRDLHPRLLGLHRRAWSRFFAVNVSWIPWVLAGAVVVYLLLAAPLQSVVASTGFVSLSLEMVVLLLFQTSFGYVYYGYGLMVTVFMLGLTAGSWFASGSRRTGAALPWLRALEICLLAGIGLMLLLTASTGLWKSGSVQVVLILGAAIITGAQFPLAANLERGRAHAVAGKLYAADLFGAAAGSLLCASFFLPSFGVVGTLALLALIKAAATVRLFTARAW